LLNVNVTLVLPNANVDRIKKLLVVICLFSHLFNVFVKISSIYCHILFFVCVRAVVPNLWVNYPPGVICDSSVGNAKPRSQCLSVLWVITAIEIFDLKRKKIFWG